MLSGALMSVSVARTLYDKIWDAHVVADDDGETLLYVDLHLIHEVTSPQAFAGLAAAGLGVRRPALALALSDHNVPTVNQDAGTSAVTDEEARAQLEALAENSDRAGIERFAMGDSRNGIVHVVGPEQGRSQPGMTIVCGDSHTSTHGAFGALAFGIGTSEVEHVLATQTIRQRRALNMRIHVTGSLSPHVYAKDLALYILQQVGVDGANGHVVEFVGEAIRSLSMEARMTLCNLSIEMGARAGLVAPDEKTYAYLKGRPASPDGAAWTARLEQWQLLSSDPQASYDRQIDIDARRVRPMVSWGTNPSQIIAIDETVPDPAALGDAVARAEANRALDYMGLSPGMPIAGLRLDRIFIGSCTNSRIEDLRAAAAIVNGRTVASHVDAMIVPGSGLVKIQAEAEGLDRIFRDAGFDWRQPGCSMCVGMNADKLLSGERCGSTSNRNFENRQGQAGRTHLMSPAMAAASAIAGYIIDPDQC
tara:strand:+ start:32781 stop:34214 length:1434 start_codon:yes stop_codon:yes gene_type:complete